jgi:sugar phosphate isomerase/epimerase
MSLPEIGIACWAFHRNILQEKTLSLLDLPALARQKYGVGTIELVSEFFESQTAGYLNQLRRNLEAEGVRVHSIGLDHGNISTPDEAVRRTSLEALKQWFYVARAIGAGAVRVNTNDFEPLVEMIKNRQPIPTSAILFSWDSLSAGERQAALERSVAAYTELVALAAQTGVRLMLENHGGVTGEPDTIAQILARIDSPWFVTCPDNQNPFTGNAWEAGTQTLASRAYSVQLKISGYEPDGMQTFKSPNGATRNQDLRRFLEILLVEHSYRGPLNFEYNFAEADEYEGTRKGLAYLRELVGEVVSNQ